MTWYAWAFLILLLLAWLLLFYQCLRFLDCCSGPRTHKGVQRDSDGRLLACTFCHIAHQPPPPTPPSPQSPLPSSPPSPSPSSSPSSPSSALHLIPDPSLPAPLPAASHLTPTPILYSTPWVVVFSPRSPAAARHLLVVPKAHIDDCDALVEGSRDRPPQPGGGAVEGGDEGEGWGEGGGMVREEEEKELTPLQYLDHMLEVGRFVLSHPHLMANPSGGLALTRRRRRWTRRLCCVGRGAGREGPGRPQIAAGGSDKVWMMARAKGVRRRWAPSPVAPVDTQPDARSGGGDDRGGEREEDEAEAAYRFCFHAPPHNSIAHLHLHCFELPFVSFWDDWSFRPHTRWCREAGEVREEILRRERLAGDVR